jgi:hypothetical protein
MKWFHHARPGIDSHHPLGTTLRSSFRHLGDTLTHRSTHRRDQRSEWSERSVVCEPIEREDIWVIRGCPEHCFSLHFLFMSHQSITLFTQWRYPLTRFMDSGLPVLWITFAATFVTDL